MSKNLGILLVCSQPYIRHIENEEKFVEANSILFNAISDVYLPLLDLFHRLDENGSDFKVSMVIPPVLTSLLSDPVVQAQYISHLDRKIELGKKEIVRLANEDLLLANAQKCLDKALKDKFDFCERYQQKLIEQFSALSKKGHIELLATTGTSVYLPHYSDMTEILNAQVETGLFSFRKTFNEFPEGFYLPHLGYEKGLDKILKSYNMRYTILDSKSLLFSEDEHSKGVFYPYRFTDSTLSFFASDFDSTEEISRFLDNPVYRNNSRDVGYELSYSELSDFVQEGNARVPTGFRYWSKGGAAYNESKALKQAEIDARIFLKNKNERLAKAQELLKDEVSLVSVIPCDVLSDSWGEGIDFLENVIKISSEEFDVTTEKCADLMEKQFKMSRVEPYSCSNEGSGFGENLLDGSNSWMLRFSRKMCRRMIDISSRFPDETGLKVRLLNLGARELLIAMSSTWPSFIHEGNLSDYSEKVFKDCIKSFTIMYDALGSNTVSTEWLTNLEKVHPIFPWMNFRIFSPKI